MPVIPALRKQKQKYDGKFKATLIYKILPCQKTKTNNNKTEVRDWRRGIKRRGMEKEGNS